MDTIEEQFKQMLEDALEETGGSLSQSADKVAKYMGERARHLSTIVDQVGFDQAVRAERNNVAMKAGLSLADNAEAWNARIVGIIQGALRIAAGAYA